MDDRDGAGGEILPTLGLLLMLTAVVGFALFLSTLGAGSGPSGLAAGVTALTFLGSLACFAIDGVGGEDRPGQSARAATVTTRTV
ncbi:hypothetical protein B1R94_02640 [Mycolicibacterium litorale]|nr:hypothetical protein B1R94_02640 [Mycolicibacterium litorale]